MPNFYYKPMWEIKFPSKPSNSQLNCLAESMSKKKPFDDSKIPAGYTYLSQFIAHEIANDSLDEVNIFGNAQSISEFENKHKPSFDLKTIYGLNALPDRRVLQINSNTLLKVGETIPRSKLPSFKNDLPRCDGDKKADIIDKRNDENLTVAQMQVAFMRFHNAIVKSLGEPDTVNTFMKARRIAIRHYQWIVLHDFLPRIVNKEVLDDVKKIGNKFYTPKDDDIYMPFEFAIGAFRAGHSMVKNVYNWNIRRCLNGDDFRASVHELKQFTGSSCPNFECLGGDLKLRSGWVINWNWFFDINNSIERDKVFFNFANKINTNISSYLGSLSPKPREDFLEYISLPAIDLYRSRYISLPTGQTIADRIDSSMILKPEDIKPLLPEAVKDIFSEETPLFFYFLAEAEINEKGETLGNIGSRIVAETFLELLKRSEYSIYGVDFPNESDFLGEKGEFGMPQMLSFIEKTEPGFINPVEHS